MKKCLQNKMKVTVVALALWATGANAQITFQSLYQRSTSGTAVIGTPPSMVLSKSATSPTLANNLSKTTGYYPMMLTTDNDGNTAFAYGTSHLLVVPKGATDKLLYFKDASAGGAILSMALDESDEFLYVGAQGQGIRRYIWKNIPGNNASIKNLLANKNVGDALPASLGAGVNYIPFVPEGAQVFLNGELTRSTLSVTRVKGLAFDTDGNLYYADANNTTNVHYIRRINVRKATGTGTQGTNTITLAAVPAGIKAGNLVSGLGIPDKTYIADSYAGGNTLTLTTEDGVTARNLTANVENTASIAIITGVDNIVGTAGSETTLPTAGQNVKLSLQDSANQPLVGMAFDAAGNLFFVDPKNGRLLKVAKGAGISNTSTVSLFTAIANENGIIGGIVIKDNHLYYTGKTTNSVYKMSLTDASTKAIIAGSGGRLNFRGSTVSGSKTITLVHPNYKPSISKIKPGMTLRADANIVVGTKVVSVDAANFTFEIEDNALATQTSLDNNPGVGANMIFSSEDGYTTTGSGVNVNGYLDGPSDLAVVDNGAGEFDILVAESNGYNIRILQSVNTLPVTLSGELSAKLTTLGHVNLSWSTTSEKGNSYFLLRRSNDGVNYVTISEQGTKGEQGGTYYFTDANPQSDVNYYSLSQIDKDGRVKELGIKSVKVAAVANGKGITVYPNPIDRAEFSINASATEESKLLVVIKDLTGKQIFFETLSKTTDGNCRVKLDNKPASGIYILTVNGGEAQKLIFK